MKTVLIVVASLMLGAVIGGYASFGAGAGLGIATGFASGACLTVEAAKTKGLMTDDDTAGLLTAAVEELGKSVPAEQVPEAVDCGKVVADLRAAAAK